MCIRDSGTWVYYNRDGERATDSWKKSGNNWYYLDSDGEMAIDQLIEDGDRTKDKTINGKKYAFDQYGAMVAEWSLDEDDLGTNPNAFTSNCLLYTSRCV